MPRTGDVGAECGAAEIVEPGGERTLGDARHGGLDGAQRMLAIGMAERHEPHRGGNSVWYWTQGDDNGNWGFVPAAVVHTKTDPAPGLIKCGD